MLIKETFRFESHQRGCLPELYVEYAENGEARQDCFPIISATGTPVEGREYDGYPYLHGRLTPSRSLQALFEKGYRPTEIGMKGVSLAMVHDSHVVHPHTSDDQRYMEALIVSEFWVVAR